MATTRFLKEDLWGFDKNFRTTYGGKVTSSGTQTFRVSSNKNNFDYMERKMPEASEPVLGTKVSVRCSEAAGLIGTVIQVAKDYCPTIYDIEFEMGDHRKMIVRCGIDSIHMLNQEVFTPKPKKMDLLEEIYGSD
jgi:hypothetical protein